MEKKVIVKKDWISSFVLTGEPKISEDYTFKVDQRSDRAKEKHHICQTVPGQRFLKVESRIGKTCPCKGCKYSKGCKDLYGL